ncbi:NYN domain-containing protein [Kitasatospora sp. NPDC002227]|uniref:NYN domain-containing protein n=1 Tax=Kitasatospora sp. NPDC002227 TaxID=3154773 RepID=UPI0033208870
MMRVFRWLRYWPDWSGYAAALWSLLYGAAGLYWALGGGGYPFAKVSPGRSGLSVLEPSRAEVVAPVIAVLGLAGAVAGVLMARGHGHGRARYALLGFGWLQAVTLALVLPDYTLIGILALWPVLLVFCFTGVPGPQQTIGNVIFWHRENLIIIFLGGLLWAAATLAYQRRTGGHCVRCGRGGRAAGAWTRPEAALRWGRWAVRVAVVSTLPYEITRLAWYFGYPLGITRAFEADMQHTPHLLEIGLCLGLASLGGSLLTHGLVSGWGEVWPRWVWWKAGRPVHPATAIVPASTVAVVLIPGGLMMARAGLSADMWGTNGPGILWIVWGAALGAATLAYHLRRRGSCRHCGLGAPAVEPECVLV